MPNFKAKSIKELTLPFCSNGVEFLWKAYNENVILIFTKVEEESFFLQVKQDNQFFIIKADKHSKPSKITYLQKALLCFKENFCNEIVSESFAFKKNALDKKIPLIAYDFNEVLEKIQNYKKIYIEIGFGSGRHLLYQAKTNQDILILGIEIYTPAIEQVAKLALNQEINNILLIQSDARLLLSVLQKQSIDKIFLHFPVPWDKKPHRRVMSEAFSKECARVLKSNGKFELRTDSYEYFNYSLGIFLEFENPKFDIKKNEDLEISSKYEDRWKKQNKNIYDLIVYNLNSFDQERSIIDFNLQSIHFSKEQLKLLRNFKNQTFKYKDFFLHIENFYITSDSLVVKIAFGAFNKPEHAYIFLGDKCYFVFKAPFKTLENLKAIEEFKKIIYYENRLFS
ncbi:tRNA (guanosine(46)-N7)-methyltransferase TrmB [Campylobacter novaezeelandiae]|uniref:tRNA (guanine-N(7)-)-methyltransferase n=1 Tax=Campylobacter novaezeelandiae TaxID=2267891 RepID=A0A4Q9JTW3_9BACT|nr:tRNA (guanosine(46)-N7)-methyltransferase TrmB [Campylobacter novaezeelandiae]TBR79454.1 tRNA (guanosine(46)-N7)-methyltransferase TrmB [Campylobacter novaezeelandiae]TBR80588.1 tRNA (guanosine(46)-N7)-methyltransferase TrmB [Campylobacter novaezeelandiae]TBR80769.1 tRNA (guanosine(46)-N7)-methyltransferase TrmB [Campylobacter novaezeelandiae]